MHMTVRDGVRESTSRAYLHPVLNRPNLTLITKALAKTIEFVGLRAIGVNVEIGGKPQTFCAAQEVLIAAGAIASPALLQRSGIGPSRLIHYRLICFWNSKMIELPIFTSLITIDVKFSAVQILEILPKATPVDLC